MNKRSAAIMVGIMGINMGHCLSVNSFVVSKTKKLSVASIKEHYAQSIGDVLRESTLILSGIARLQEMGMDIVTQIMEEEFFSHATKEMLEGDLLPLEQFVSRQEQINDLVQQQIDFLNVQKKKYRTKKT